MQEDYYGIWHNLLCEERFVKRFLFVLNINMKIRPALTTLLLSIMLGGCAQIETLPPNLAELRAQQPVSESYNVTFLFSDSAVVKARLKAPHLFDMQTATSHQTITYADKGIAVEFLDSRGHAGTKMTAQRAEIYDEKGFAKAMGNVVVINEKGEKLETEVLNWYRDEERIRTPAFVKITTADEIIFGDSLDSDVNFSSYTIYKIKGTLSLKGEQ